jgi:uncharacterized OsmC-like protein
MDYHIRAERIDAERSRVRCKKAELTIDTKVAGSETLFNPAELLLTSIAACLIKGIERISPQIHFRYKGVLVDVYGERQESPPKMVDINYSIEIDTDESDERIDLLKRNIEKFGTIYNTLAESTGLTGTIVRMG